MSFFWVSRLLIIIHSAASWLPECPRCCHWPPHFALKSHPVLGSLNFLWTTCLLPCTCWYVSTNLIVCCCFFKLPFLKKKNKNRGCWKGIFSPLVLLQNTFPMMSSQQLIHRLYPYRSILGKEGHTAVENVLSVGRDVNSSKYRTLSVECIDTR